MFLHFDHAGCWAGRKGASSVIEETFERGENLDVVGVADFLVTDSGELGASLFPGFDPAADVGVNGIDRHVSIIATIDEYGAWSKL